MLTRNLAAVLAIAAVNPAFAQADATLVEGNRPLSSTAQAAPSDGAALPFDEALGIAAENNPLLRGARSGQRHAAGEARFRPHAPLFVRNELVMLVH
jgi:cobalt-zinc-cadmium efflux system outer membrane protein